MNSKQSTSVEVTIFIGVHVSRNRLHRDMFLYTGRPTTVKFNSLQHLHYVFTETPEFEIEFPHTVSIQANMLARYTIRLSRNDTMLCELAPDLVKLH